MAPRATAACALAALLLVLAASDSHAFFGWISDDATTDAPVVSTESSPTTSGGRVRSSKSSRHRGSAKNSSATLEFTGHPPGHSSASRSSGRTRHKSRPHTKANATIFIQPPPMKLQEETTEQQGPVETSPSQPAAPPEEKIAGSSLFPPTVITETVRMEDGNLVARVDVPAESPVLPANGLRPISSLAEIGDLFGNQESVWGPYPTELNSLPFDYSGMDQMSFPYGQNSLPPWWPNRPFPMARNTWYPMSQISYNPWRSSRLGLPPMMNPYTQTWLRGRGRRQTVLPDSFNSEGLAQNAPLDPWSGYFGNSYYAYGYSGWPSYTASMRMYVPPYAYPWGPVTTRWVSKPFSQRVAKPSGSDAAGEPSPPSPSPPHADAQPGTGAEHTPTQVFCFPGGAHHHSHHLRHSKHRFHAPMRLQPPPWMLPQRHHPRWPSVASLPQMLPVRRYMQSPPAHVPALAAAGPAPAPPTPSPTPPPTSAESEEDEEMYED